MTTGILISTYNWPSALELCIRSIAAQSLMPDEIIICDDGSDETTLHLIERLRKELSLTLLHVWHPDNGFQLAAIRNKGIAISKSDYIIQIDGDLILHRHFVRDHVSVAKRGFFVSGSRVLLSKITTTNLTQNPAVTWNWQHNGSTNFLNSLWIPLFQRLLANTYKVKGRYKYYVKGCNMAFWRPDLMRVNGYNENFLGWGREDTELAVRLINSGLKKRFIKFGAICYHLFHNEVSRENEPENLGRVKSALSKGTTWVEKGIIQHLSDNYDLDDRKHGS